MTEVEVFENFQAIVQSLPDLDCKRLLSAFTDVLQAKKDSLDVGWEQMSFYDEAGNFSKEQAFLALLERGTKKITYQEIIDLIDQFIHPPEPEKEG